MSLCLQTKCGKHNTNAAQAFHAERVSVPPPKVNNRDSGYFLFSGTDLAHAKTSIICLSILEILSKSAII